MDEQVRQETVTEETRSFDRDRVSALSRAIWRDFGPLIMGAIVLLAVLIGGWYLWNKSRGPAETPPVVVEETDENGSEVSLPTSEITIPGVASPRPTPTTSPSPAISPSPAGKLADGKGQPEVTTGTGMTKGEQLPKTGLPFAQILLFSALPGIGFALHKLSKRV